MKYSKRLSILLEIVLPNLSDGELVSGAWLLGNIGNNKNSTNSTSSTDTGANTNTNSEVNDKEDLIFFTDGEKKWKELWDNSSNPEIYYYLIVRSAILANTHNAPQATKESTLNNYALMIKIFKETISNIFSFNKTKIGCYERLKKINNEIISSQVNKKDFAILSELGKYHLISSIKSDRANFNDWFEEQIQKPFRKEKETK